jgi:hypothetical protein
MVIHMVTTATMGYTILLHIDLFGIFPLLAFVPFLIVCVLVHFVIQSQKAAAKLRLARLCPVTSASPGNVRSVSEKRTPIRKSAHITRRQSVQQGASIIDMIENKDTPRVDRLHTASFSEYKNIRAYSEEYNSDRVSGVEKKESVGDDLVAKPTIKASTTRINDIPAGGIQLINLEELNENSSVTRSSVRVISEKSVPQAQSVSHSSGSADKKWSSDASIVVSSCAPSVFLSSESGEEGMDEAVSVSVSVFPQSNCDFKSGIEDCTISFEEGSDHDRLSPSSFESFDSHDNIHSSSDFDDVSSSDDDE